MSASSSKDKGEIEEWEKEHLPDFVLNEVSQAGPFEIWEENLESADLFFLCSTQWRVSMAGITGLDYASVVAVMGAVGVPREELKEKLNDIRLIEIGVLKAK